MQRTWPSYPSDTVRSRATHTKSFESGARGTIASGTRFQVSLPTPFGVLGHAIVPEELGDLLPYFEEVYRAEIAAIASAIPPADLAIQWDLAIEIIGALLGRAPSLCERFPIEDLAKSIARMSESIPREAEIGIHFLLWQS